MNEIINSRRVQPYIGINGKDIWGDIKDYNVSFSYEDCATGATDSLDISMHDIKGHWITDWIIDKGTALDAKIYLSDWFKPGEHDWINCGEFLCDSLEITGYPIQCKIGALALPINGTKNTKKWEKISIRAIAQDICNYIGVGLEYYADDATIKTINQSRQSDINFLFNICKDYGLGMKVFKHKIIIFDREAADKADNVGTLHLSDFATDFTINDNQEGTYTGATIKYSVEGSDNTQTYTVGSSERLLVIDQTCSSFQEAQLKCKGNLFDTNAEAIKLKFGCMGGYRIFSGTNYWIDTIGRYSGKYAIDKVIHDIDNGAYKMSVTAHKVAVADTVSYIPSHDDM